MIRHAAPHDDPECRECGCPDTRIVRQFETFGRTSEEWECNNCGHRWATLSLVETN